jgi:transposase
LLAGGHRLGKRAISQAMNDLFGLPISPAAVCDLQAKTATALEPIHTAALRYTRTRPANVDETGWKQGRAKAWLWAAVTTLVTAFVIRPRRNRAAFDDLVGPNPPTLTTDRFAVYAHLPSDRRQVCWAHLRRDFQAMIDRRNAGSAIGADLLAHADILFERWQRVRDAEPRRVSRAVCLLAAPRGAELAGTRVGVGVRPDGGDVSGNPGGGSVVVDVRFDRRGRADQ